MFFFHPPEQGGLFPQRDVQNIGESNLRFLPRVDRLSHDLIALDLLRSDLQTGRSLMQQLFLVTGYIEQDFGYSDHIGFSS